MSDHSGINIVVNKYDFKICMMVLLGDISEDSPFASLQFLDIISIVT